MDEGIAGAERPNLGGIIIDAGHAVADFRETGGRDQANVPRADHRNLHRAAFSCVDSNSAIESGRWS